MVLVSLYPTYCRNVHTETMRNKQPQTSEKEHKPVGAQSEMGGNSLADAEREDTPSDNGNEMITEDIEQHHQTTDQHRENLILAVQTLEGKASKLHPHSPGRGRGK